MSVNHKSTNMAEKDCLTVPVQHEPPVGETDGSLVTVKEMASYLGVTQRTVYRLMKEYHMPASKIGGQWRFKVELVEAWMRKEYNASE